MKYQDYYTISLALNGQDLNMTPEEMYFSIHDSIHNFFSSAKIQFNDPTGNIREYLGVMEGNTYSLTYGLDDKLLKADYVILSDEMPEVTMPGILGGKIQMNLLHDYYTRQEVLNVAYNNRISSIVNSIASEWPFKSVVMNDTSSDTSWYRLGMNQKDFIEKVLLPNSYSYNSDRTPFFAFIDTENIFQYRNYKSMSEARPVAELTYTPINPSQVTRGSIYSIKPFKVGSDMTKNLRKRQVVSRSLTDGSYTKEEDVLQDFPTSRNFKYRLPIIGNNDFFTDYKYYSFSYTETGEADAFKARVIHDEYKGFFLEKFVVITAFNPLIKSGTTVDLKVSVLDENQAPFYSLYMSGVYLVEDCIHSWEGGNIKSGSTQLIISRKFIDVPSTTHKLSQFLIG